MKKKIIIQLIGAICIFIMLFHLKNNTISKVLALISGYALMTISIDWIKCLIKNKS